MLQSDAFCNAAKCDCGQGSGPDPLEELNYSAAPDPLTGFKRAASRRGGEGEGRKEEVRGGKGKGGQGQGGRGRRRGD